MLQESGVPKRQKGSEPFKAAWVFDVLLWSWINQRRGSQLPRKPRFFLPDVPVHIVQRGHSREPVFFENDDYSARVAYNYRSEYMVREYGKYYGNRMHDDFGTLDLTFGWNFSENIAFRLEGVNLTEEDDVQYGAAAAGTAVKPALQEGYPTWSFNGETTYKLGASFKF